MIEKLLPAEASKDAIAWTRSLMSHRTNHIITGDAKIGLDMLEQARELFECGDSYDHQQGLGWFWILQADLANAGIIEKAPAEIVDTADRAVEILMPIENWPGVARAYSSRAGSTLRIGGEGRCSRRSGKTTVFREHRRASWHRIKSLENKTIEEPP